MDKLRVEDFTYELTPEGICRVTWSGKATEATIRALRDFGAAARARLPEGELCHAIVDATDATGIDRRARKQLIELGHDKPWDRVAFVGVRFELKVMLELIVKALKLMNIETADLRFVDSVDEGLAWFEDELSTDDSAPTQPVAAAGNQSPRSRS